ncbi:MAG: addiction module toxin, HicA family [Kiritimatiellae bacterium]|nr:addiction module toxin, HicA family [Kiritimatiellia bacterium]
MEALIFALGGKISEGRGSRVQIFLNGIRAVFHRPHPKCVTEKGAVKSIQKFLKEAEVRS